MLRLPLFYWGCLLFFFMSTVYTSFFTSFLASLISFRWFIPLILFPLFYLLVDTRTQEKAASALVFIFILAFIMQIVQLFSSQYYFGMSALGLAARSPGIFVIPSTMASFTMLVLYYVFFYYKKSSWLVNGLLYGLCPLSLSLTGSGSGYISLAMFGCFALCHNLNFSFAIKLIISVLASISMFFLLPVFSERGVDIYKSMWFRVHLLLKHIDSKLIFFSTNSARGTNLGYMIDELGLNIVMADSTLLSLILSIGLCGTCCFFILYFQYMKISNLKWQLYFASTFPFILSAIAFEVYPFNIFMILNLAYLIRLTVTHQLD
jgi:hypothetical protein